MKQTPSVTSWRDTLTERFQSGVASIGIIGLGYVGLPLSGVMHDAGFSVLGFDLDVTKIRDLTVGESYLFHLGPELVTRLSTSDRFEATSDFERLSEPDAIIVCVPTPLGVHQEPDLSYVLGTATAIGSYVRPGQLVVLESTTYPSTTRDEFMPELLRPAESRGLHLQLGSDFFLAYSPEREDPGRKDFTTARIPKLVGGIDEVSTSLAAVLYRKAVIEVVEVASAEVAEAAKLLENIFRSVNIALVNEMKTILTPMGVDVWEVVRAAATKPFGFMPFYPGPGLGGHCIPIDPFYLTWKAREVGHVTRFIQLAGEINTSMPSYVVRRVGEALNRRQQSLSGATVLILGLAYKPNVDDTRESPAFEIIELLLKSGASVQYHDPHVHVAPKVRKHDIGLRSVELTRESVADYNVVVVVTDHRSVDYQMVSETARLVVDTRDVMRPYERQLGERLVRA